VGHDLKDVLDPQVYAPRAQRLRMIRVQAFADYCVKMEGQDLTIVVRRFSREWGVSVEKVQEYWDVIAEDNRGNIYVRDGIVRTRRRRGSRR